MFKLALFALFFVAMASAYEVVEDESGQSYLLVPVLEEQQHHRQRRADRGNVGVQVDHRRGYGTDVSAQAKANLWRQGNSRLDAVGQYGRHFGGQGGTGRANTYGGLQFTHRF